jgi:hypothetical protein
MIFLRKSLLRAERVRASLALGVLNDKSGLGTPRSIPLDGACTTMLSPRLSAGWCLIVMISLFPWSLYADSTYEISRTMRLEHHAQRLIRLCEAGSATGRLVPLHGADLTEFRGLLGQLAATNPTDAAKMRQTFSRLSGLCDRIGSIPLTPPTPAPATIWAVSLGSTSLRTPTVTSAEDKLPLTLTPAQQAWRDICHEVRALELRWRQIEASGEPLHGHLARHGS